MVNVDQVNGQWVNDQVSGVCSQWGLLLKRLEFLRFALGVAGGVVAGKRGRHVVSGAEQGRRESRARPFIALAKKGVVEAEQGE